MKVKSKLFYGYIFFLVVYSAFLLIPKPPTATLKQYHISTLGVRLLDVVIILLLAGIWFAGFYGYVKLKLYVDSIKSYKDGQHISIICQGLLWLALWLPVSETISAILNFFTIRHPKLLPTSTVINNYINLLLPFVAFTLISLGADRLGRMAKVRPNYWVRQLIGLFVIYTGLIYYRFVRLTPNRNSVYHISLWLIMLTIAAPYIFMWLTGLYAAYQIFLYQSQVAGVVYRKSWRLLALGLVLLILTSIILQFLTTLQTHLMKLTIYGLLAVIFALLLILAAGFLLVSAGIRRLTSLEAV